MGLLLSCSKSYGFIIAPVTVIFTWLAIFALKDKDRTEFFGTGEPVKVTFKDYWDVLKNNRAIQMLVSISFNR